MSIENGILSFPHFLRLAMCNETTYRTYGGNVELNRCYRHVAPLEQKYTFWVLCWISLSFKRTYIVNQFLISNSRYR